MHPRDVVRLSVLVSVGGLALAIGTWMVLFGLGTESSPLGALFLIPGLVVLAVAFLLIGGAGVDSVWERLHKRRVKEDRQERLREREEGP